MEAFWVCSECGSSNIYPDVTECDVCGKSIDDREKKDAVQRIKAEEKLIEENKRKEEEEERLRKQREREEEIQARLKAKREKKERELRLKRARMARKLKKRAEAETKFFNGYCKALNVIKKCLVCLMVVSILIVGVSIVRQDSTDAIVSKVEKRVETIVKDFKKSHYTSGKKSDPEFKPFYNIEKQYKHLEKKFKNSENIENLMDMLGW